MKNRILSVLAAAALGLLSAHALAQYKHVGPDGKVTYSDTPPPAAKGVQKKELTSAAPSAGASSGAGLPYELGLAAKNFPVVIYATPGCDGCDQGRSFLVKRGIPFSEKSITTNEDLTALKQLAGSAGLPVMTVGNNKLLGFEPTAWGSALDNGGYPATSALPRSYKAAPVSPLVAAKVPPPAAPTAATQTTAQTPADDKGVSPPAPAPAEKPAWFKGF